MTTCITPRRECATTETAAERAERLALRDAIERAERLALRDAIERAVLDREAADHYARADPLHVALARIAATKGRGNG